MKTLLLGLCLFGCGKAVDKTPPPPPVSLTYSVQIENVTIEGVVLNASDIEKEKTKIESAILYSEPL